MTEARPAIPPIPFATAGLPGTGGLLRVVDDDFQVEEVPAYLPSGEGEHLYLWVEKRGLTTVDAAHLLAKRAGLRDRDVGYAGLKDKRALTRQWLSVAVRDDAGWAGFEAPGLKVLSAKRHGNKLKTGHLRGNRFTLGLRGGTPDAEARARAVLEALAQTGVPNAYGPQRFGKNDETATLGHALLAQRPHPELARAQRDRFLKRLALSAFQSRLFNALLAQRLGDSSWLRALDGDVLQKPTGACFVSEAPEVDQPRVDSFEVSPAGPIFGPKMLEARGEARARELEVLERAGVDEALFIRGGELTQGARRALRVTLTDVEVEAQSEVLWVRFSLPRGSYASVVMAEIMKADVALPDHGD